MVLKMINRHEIKNDPSYFLVHTTSLVVNNWMVQVITPGGGGGGLSVVIIFNTTF